MQILGLLVDYGLQCLSCSAAVSPTECDTVKLCGPHEICFVEVSVSDSGLIRYHLGCRDSQQCLQHNGKRHVVTDSPLQTNTENKPKNHSGLIDHLLYVNHRRSQGLPVCSVCCSSTLCNSAGCGHTGYMPHRGPVCFNCPLQQSPDDCDVITVCGQDQTCLFTKTFSTVTHLDIYQTKCEDKVTCRVTESISLIGKRQIEGGNCGTHCCNADLCNLGCSDTTAPSGVVVTSPLPITVPDPCTANPCVRGTCSSALQSYNCTCDTGYIGRNCDQHASATHAVTTIRTPTIASTTTTIRQTTTPTTVRPTTTTTTTARPTTTTSTIRPTTTLTTVRPTTTTTTTARPTTTTTTTIRPTSTTTTTILPTTTTTTTTTTIPTTTLIMEACPSGWSEFGRSCYYISTQPLTWFNSQGFCQSMGGYLVSINTQEENNYLLQWVLYYIANFWVGGNDFEIKGQYKWATGEPMTYQYWMYGEPNNDHGKENCIDLKPVHHVYQGSPGWNDEDCQMQQRFFCERPSNGRMSTRFENSCYHFGHDSHTWASAQVICQGLGANLVSINSEREDIFVQDEMPANFWLGGNALEIEGHFKWVSCEPMIYKNWNAGEPNNLRGHENCIDIKLIPGNITGWNDEDCLVLQRYICEKPSTPNVIIG